MVDAPHIQTAYDEELESIQALIMRMGGLVEAAIMDAASSLEQRDEERAEAVRRGDSAVDRLEDMINDEVARIIARRAPNSTDLRMVLSIMRIASNLERVGDYAANMAKRTSVLVQMTPVGTSASSLRRMAKAVEGMMKDALDAYVQRDAELALEVRHRDEEVDQMYNATFRELLTHMMEDPRNITPCMHLHFIAKNIERMGDHVTSISEQVIYLATGKAPTEDRPKGDRTPFETHGTETAG
jgi:phosphate transport system protein